jgi:hypothetical protein
LPQGLRITTHIADVSDETQVQLRVLVWFPRRAAWQGCCLPSSDLAAQEHDGRQLSAYWRR